MDDEYSWRKYGQKDIHGAKYHRSYYRGCVVTHGWKAYNRRREKGPMVIAQSAAQQDEAQTLVSMSCHEGGDQEREKEETSNKREAPGQQRRENSLQKKEGRWLGKEGVWCKGNH
uniref:WRKY transcription factor protein 5 n=1 Tax=Zanthoxylum armatum TaxID=67938 RepID=A0A8F1SZI5_9ROSI|nr:WRKY transcription factor protein 5 [Zanthoxylum armatum]